MVVWSYPRGTGLSKAGETGIDVTAYAAQIAAQLGANIIKVKPPTAHIEQRRAPRLPREGRNIPMATLADRVRHVVQGAFDGRRIVIFSGGEAKGIDAVLEEIRQTALGGGFGTIMGRNSLPAPARRGRRTAPQGHGDPSHDVACLSFSFFRRAVGFTGAAARRGRAAAFLAGARPAALAVSFVAGCGQGGIGYSTTTTGSRSRYDASLALADHAQAQRLTGSKPAYVVAFLDPAAPRAAAATWTACGWP